ncbi:hypothetical protein ACK3TF_004713 [Chlorella vulgaris]
MDQAGQPHAVEMAAAAQTTQVVATVEAVLAVHAVQAHLHEHGGLTAENANLKAELAEVKAENTNLQARIDELEELQHAPWHQALLAYARKHGLLLKCWVVVAAVMGGVLGLVGWLRDYDGMLFAVAVLSIVQSINSTTMLAPLTSALLLSSAAAQPAWLCC